MITVAIVDDSAVVRQVLSNAINQQNDMEVLYAVQNPLFAERRFEKAWPDVIVLDIEMPEKDGLTFLKEIMKSHPTPVIMCSTLTVDKSKKAMEALALGAFDTVAKPKIDIKSGLLAESASLISLIRAASNSNISKSHNQTAQPETTKASEAELKSTHIKNENKQSKTVNTAIHAIPNKKINRHRASSIIAIGSSTGGTIAIESILNNLNPDTTPGIVITQHMPAGFTAAFAARLNKLTGFTVSEAQHGDNVTPGHVYIAPGDMHLSITLKANTHFKCEVKAGPAVNRHCPSVDVLFRSVARTAKHNATAILLTGMGADGAQGLLAARESGVHTIAQDQQSSVVFGMPKEAIKLNAADHVLSLNELPTYLNSLYSHPRPSMETQDHD